MRLLGLALSVAFGTFLGAQAAPSASRVAIVGVTVIDADAAIPARRDQTVLIEDGVIRAVGRSRDVVLSRGTRVVDGRGKFAIPGLWDMHVHFMNTGVSALPLLLANGVTGVREMGGYLDSTRAWQVRMHAGTLLGPRIVTPGPILESPRYLQNVRERSARLDGRLALRVLPYRIGVSDTADARRALDSLAALRVDFVKIRTVASPESFFAILREARRVGLRVSGHPPLGVSLATASDSGQRSIEHGFVPFLSRLSQGARDSLYRRFAMNGTWYTPTLTVSRAVMLSGAAADSAIFGEPSKRDPRRAYASPWLLEWWRMQVDERIKDTSSALTGVMQEGYASTASDVRGMHDAGVNLLAGTDAGSVFVYPGFSLHEELSHMVMDAGLAPKAALWTATVGPARYLGLESTLGAVAPGRTADIVLLDADPLVDIDNTRRIFAVVQNGRIFGRDRLDSMLAGVRRVAREGARPE